MDQQSYKLLVEMNGKLGRIEARLDAAAESRRHLRRELATVRKLAEGNNRDITLAKGGSLFATLASTFAGLYAYFQ